MYAPQEVNKGFMLSSWVEKKDLTRTELKRMSNVQEHVTIISDSKRKKTNEYETCIVDSKA